MSKNQLPIFIIDDDRSFGKSLQFMLTCRGMGATWFESAYTFLDAIPSGQKGIAIIDIHMLPLGGFWLSDRMKELGYTMPILLITGQTEPDTRDMAMRRGAVGFLQKPFLMSSLLNEIERLQN